MRLALGAAALCLAASPALAAPAPVIPPQPPTTVSSLTVYPKTDPPKIVSSYPAAGAVVAPGVLVLKVTFDQKMLKTGFAFAAGPGGQMPACLKTPRLLNDDKTFVLLCTIGANSSYSIAINPGPQGGFANVGETRAEPTTLAFATNADPGPTDLAAAMKAEKLTDVDEPIQESEFAPPAARP
ncbi:MAG: hypothetical protein E7812_09710 [Phenylobacterium sp.]|nr:MAG: hypothetical protein E7812_09710 [Phenylobacterium sp.]